MNNRVIGLDIAKNIFHIYTMTDEDKAVKKVLKRKQVLEYFANYPVNLIGIEACGLIIALWISLKVSHWCHCACRGNVSLNGNYAVFHGSGKLVD